MTNSKKDSFKSRTTLSAGGKEYHYYSLPIAAGELGIDLKRLPYSLKVLFENMLRFEDGESVTKKDISAFKEWIEKKTNPREINYRPARVLMQDFTGVPAVVDLAAMRDAAKRAGAKVDVINPLVPVDMVVDHSVMVDHYGQTTSFDENVKLEMERNGERYEFLRWGQEAFDNFRVVPPGTGICHQVNLEYLAQVVWTKEENGKTIAYPDTVVGTDSHTTMINGLGVLGWGVGGIEAEAAMLGQPVSMLIPDVVGFKLTGKLREGVTATDLVLTVTNMLRKKGVVNKFVEFYGAGLEDLPLADRATIANMAPEYGATCGIFPIDGETIRYLELTARDKSRIALVEAYAKAQGMWRDDDGSKTVYSDTLELDIAAVQPSLAGPKRPQDRVNLSDAPASFAGAFKEMDKGKTAADARLKVEGTDYTLGHGDVVIAAITSCTNTSNPYVMMAAGLVAKKANALGMKTKPWVKTSLAPGSQVVTEYLAKAGLNKDLDALGFNLVGYGCTTCIGNSGPLNQPIEDAIASGDLVVSSVLSGNRNFEGRVHARVKTNYLASPPLVVAYALAGTMHINLTTDPIGKDKKGKDVFLKDIWPTNKEVHDAVEQSVTREMFASKYKDVFAGDKYWKAIKITKGDTFKWNDKSTYVQNPPYFVSEKAASGNVIGANILGIFGDSITTDHISPAGNIASNGPAAKYLTDNGVTKADFNSYGARRGNHEVMMRGTFANIRIKNEMVPGTEGGITKYIPSGETMSIYDAAMRYQAQGTPLVIFGGKEYGTGSSRDWAAKGTFLLGVKAVIVESFERIHRSNLVGMGVLPLVFKDGKTRNDLKLDGSEKVTLTGLEVLKPRMDVTVTVERKDGQKETFTVLCRLDTEEEIAYFKSGGILQYVMGNLTNVA
jgi:aconitate hydratase